MKQKYNIGDEVMVRDDEDFKAIVVGIDLLKYTEVVSYTVEEDGKYRTDGFPEESLSLCGELPLEVREKRVQNFIESYGLRHDDGFDYVPTPWENILITDFIHNLQESGLIRI